MSKPKKRTRATIAAGVAKRCGLPETAARSNLAEVCGDTGSAHAMLLLTLTLHQLALLRSQQMPLHL